MLAIEGGEPQRTKAFPAWPHYGEEEFSALSRVLKQGTWWRGEATEVAQFEAEFAAFHGSPFALAVTTGTHAAEVALLAHSVGPGDEVIVPALGFVSAVTAVQRLGAVPVFADCDLDTWNLSARSVSNLLRDATRAIIPVHIAGNSADMDALTSTLNARKIAVIQDAAHAHGMRFRDKPVGSLSSTSCFSFQNAKLMTAGEGGAILFRDEELFKRAFLFHNNGRVITDRYEHVVIGSNYRMNEFSGALLREQLKRLPKQMATREKNAEALREYLSKIQGVIVQTVSVGTTRHSNYLIPFRLNGELLNGSSREWFLNALKAEGIPAVRSYRPLFETETSRLSAEKNVDLTMLRSRCPNACTIGDSGICLHHKVLLGDLQDVKDVAEAVAKIVARRSRSP